ncbi:hypothetical protein AN639_07175 [Candidatus Epulonipiscium fishelsonii]|uniref:Uncharacterized protein n=1 Tax=Candidatus Epulonipiscium fishelsonii TaxID=77094 RepID=A0ACC8X912_9FIRM|nr:hypothetical protein AN396_10515 [Epulopiscium sp. SCG-B11WGA-EpuloA1]ONI38742.1 hypothetical protein AN639_07175 [Epulopiscium sp. SCG-B05WGA-EpuloA1]
MKRALILALGLIGAMSFVGCAAGYDSTTDGYGVDYYDGYGDEYYETYNGYTNGYGVDGVYTGPGVGNGTGLNY